MVLEESSAAEGGWNELPSDDTSYSAPQAVDISGYAHPFPILGPLFGFSQRRTQQLIKEEQKISHKFLGRPFHPDELEAMAQITCQRQAVLSYAAPAGAAGGLWRAHSTRATWKLPFFKMSEGFDPAEFRAFPRGPVLARGELAKTAWRVLRHSLYAANGVAFGMLLFAPYAGTVASVAMTKDPRLKELIGAMQESIKNNKDWRKDDRRGAAQSRRDPTGQGQKEAGELWGNHRRSIGAQEQQRKQDFDDASPSSGAGMDDFYASSSSSSPSSPSSSPSTAGASSRDQDSSFARSSRASSTSAPPPTSRRPQQPRRQPSAPESAQQPPTQGGYFDAFDDASPAAHPPPQQSADPARSSGGAWERLRQNAARDEQPPQRASSSSSSQQQQQQQSPPQMSDWDGSPGTRDRYSFSGADQDRQLAREEAQRKFDARIEREREGRDFSERGGTGGGKGGRKGGGQGGGRGIW